MKARTRYALMGFVGILLFGGTLVVPQLRWRAHVIYLHVTGQVPDIAFGTLVKYMMPGSEQSLTRLTSTRNPYAVIRNLSRSDADLDAGLPCSTKGVRHATVSAE